jgi:ribose-phosphate pyrophosphokinase
MSMKLGVPLAIVDKYREAANVTEVMNVIGDVTGTHCLMVDDMIDTAGTLCKGALALLDRGALSVYAYATHGFLSYDHKAGISAIDRIGNSPLVNVFLTDTIPQMTKRVPYPQNTRPTGFSKIKYLSVAPMFARAIDAIHNGNSLSSLFR